MLAVRVFSGSALSLSPFAFGLAGGDDTFDWSSFYVFFKKFRVSV